MPKQIIGTLLVILLSGGMISCSVTPKTENQKISRLVNDNKTFLVDVRIPEEYNAEKIEGAVNIPLDQVESRLSEFRGKKNIVVYCRSGIRAGKAKDLLQKNNIPDVYSGTSYQNVSELKKNKTKN
ncbi:rhodanese-like domain-containing protein [Elizabethkingia miricola]|uniref:rhodanese-like domain-containing protein n=1 Tax=Elizabethkingia miricola TaxID=172045 RepID=UPI000B34CBFE|nr:rhodanese-like domain-containing protein [Elizabethkingia miricola]NHQ65268.1 rhodanese-like domain-containing protein [Elizabethkingia miricola]NHQ69346.1 rhodanese-like domain-containing protein [Elizabethkingia miricola]NHQ77204.1 rhodanese-like domain-containing protein [Elizabethkingia miricola]PSL87409.1 rhodanese-like domain-containing protein [Elizabethkingia miricola]QHQ87136.1 rhodanese-like domain-containing protein [Elizabethkingia miricola]